MRIIPNISREQLNWNIRILDLSWPVILANLSIPLTGIVDTAVVGHLPNPAYIGAVALGALVFSTVYWMFGFLRMGTTGFVAQAFGAQNHKEVATVAMRGFGFALTVGLVLILLQAPFSAIVFHIFEASQEVERHANDYFDIRIWGVVFALANLVILGLFFGLQRMRMTLVLVFLLNGMNIILDVVFVLGLGWSVKGVAAATLLSEMTTFIVGLWLTFRVLKIPVSELVKLPIFQKNRLIALATVNINIFIRTLCIEITFLLFMWLSARSGEIILAANAILLHMMTLLAYGLDGFAHAAEALVGNAYGAKNRSMMRRYVVTTMGWSVVVAVIFCIVYAVFGSAIVSLITSIEEVKLAAGQYLLWMTIAPLICVWPFFFDGVYIGTTRTVEMRNSMFISFAAFLPVAYFGYTSFHNHGLWFALLVFMVVRGATLAMWYPKIERDAEPA